MSDSLKYSKVVTSLEFSLTNAEKLEKGNLIAQLHQKTAEADGMALPVGP